MKRDKEKEEITMKYEKAYIEIIELQETVITLVSGDGAGDGIIDWDIDIDQTS